MKAPEAVIDTAVRADRRFKAVHRTTIAGHGGEPLMLTAAISHIDRPMPLVQVRLSAHDRWWEKHARSIATYYGATPYFEYLWPRFAPLLNDSLPDTPLTELTLRIDAILREILAIDTRVSIPLDEVYDDDPAATSILHRRPAYEPLPGELSILDPLFRLGPDETRRILAKA